MVWRTSARGRAHFLIGRARERARKKHIPFDLTVQAIANVLEKGVCQVTGIPFDMSVYGGKRPWAPSIDRLDSSKGYVFGNVRVVVWAYNCAKNVWPEEVFDRLISAAASNRSTSGVVDV